MARPFTSGGANYVGVCDLASSVAWYVEKLGLHEIELEMDESEGCLALGFSNDEYIVALGPAGTLTEELRLLLFTIQYQESQRFSELAGRRPR